MAQGSLSGCRCAPLPDRSFLAGPTCGQASLRNGFGARSPRRDAEPRRTALGVETSIAAQASSPSTAQQQRLCGRHRRLRGAAACRGPLRGSAPPREQRCNGSRRRGSSQKLRALTVGSASSASICSARLSKAERTRAAAHLRNLERPLLCLSSFRHDDRQSHSSRSVRWRKTGSTRPMTAFASRH